MPKIRVEGNHILNGEVKISGAKNSAVALIPASILCDEVVEISNVPNISDIDALEEILNYLGANVKREGEHVSIDCSNTRNVSIPCELSQKLRASYYFMGALLGKYKYVDMCFPGGCSIGKRPIDLHLKGFEMLGATIEDNDDHFIIKADKLVGTDIYLDVPSVGATINIMFAAIFAKGKTVINNAAKEVEIVNIANFLNNMGAKIIGAGTSKITIEGVEELHPSEIETISDRIEAGTYILIGALLGNNLKITNIVPEHNKALFDTLTKMGVDYELGKNYAIVNKCNNLKSANVVTRTYPGFPTDLGQPMSVLLTQANGTSVLEETIWESRIGHYPYLCMMGATVTLSGLKASIKGKSHLKGSIINATDLRGGAALIMAGLIAEGTTMIYDVDYILRGYSNIIDKLSSVGAKIELQEI